MSRLYGAARQASEYVRRRFDRSVRNADRQIDQRADSDYMQSRRSLGQRLADFVFGRRRRGDGRPTEPPPPPGQTRQPRQRRTAAEWLRDAIGGGSDDQDGSGQQPPGQCRRGRPAPDRIGQVPVAGVDSANHHRDRLPGFRRLLTMTMNLAPVTSNCLDATRLTTRKTGGLSWIRCGSRPDHPTSTATITNGSREPPAFFTSRFWAVTPATAAAPVQRMPITPFRLANIKNFSGQPPPLPAERFGTICGFAGHRGDISTTTVWSNLTATIFRENQRDGDSEHEIWWNPA